MTTEKLICMSRMAARNSNILINLSHNNDHVVSVSVSIVYKAKKFGHNIVHIPPYMSMTTMGEINRGGRKSRSGFFFVPISILHRDRGPRTSSTGRDRGKNFRDVSGRAEASREKSRNRGKSR